MPPAFIHYLAHVTGAVLGDTHWGGEGPLVIPGIYTLKFEVDGKTLHANRHGEERSRTPRDHDRSRRACTICR